MTRSSPAAVGDDVCFIKVGPGLLLGLWSREGLSAEAGGLYAGDEPAPISLAHMVPDGEPVARVLEDALAGRCHVDCASDHA